MNTKVHLTAARAEVAESVLDVTLREQAEEVLLKAGALQRAIFNSANFSSIATDAKGVIQTLTSALRAYAGVHCCRSHEQDNAGRYFRPTRSNRPVPKPLALNSAIRV